MSFSTSRFALASLTALSLTACGGSGDPAEEGAATQTATTPTAPVAATTGSTTPTSSTPTVSTAPVTTTPTTTPTLESTVSATPASLTTTATSLITTVYGNLRGASVGVGASLNGAIPFPADNAWNTDVSTRPVDPNSANIIASIGNDLKLHPDFGSEKQYGQPLGIPYVVVSGTQSRVPVNFTWYSDEADPGPYPIPRTAPIEGGAAGSGDRHVIVVDKDNQRLYETANSYPKADGSWEASVGAIFHTDSNTVRPGGQPGWTSADAAGLPIFPGLVRYDEASRGAGAIKHALRFTVKTSRKAYVPPATHWASTNTNVNLAPMGMRVRLKASYVIPSTFSNESKAILTALKKYGMIVADNGSNWFLSGAPDDRWNNDRLVSEIRQVQGRHFEVIRMDGLVKP